MLLTANPIKIPPLPVQARFWGLVARLALPIGAGIVHRMNVPTGLIAAIMAGFLVAFAPTKVEASR